MSECIYYENVNGIKGLCKSEPPKITSDDGWLYPLTEKHCRCRFFEMPPEVKNLTKRQQALKNAKHS